jgi:hypothetical protein
MEQRINIDNLFTDEQMFFFRLNHKLLVEQYKDTFEYFISRDKLKSIINARIDGIDKIGNERIDFLSSYDLKTILSVIDIMNSNNIDEIWDSTMKK